MIFQIGTIPSVYSDNICQLTHSLLRFKPDKRPSTSFILSRPFIREHILILLKDAKREELLQKNEFPHSPLNSDKEKPIGSKRICEDMNSKFDSLVICGDKLKISKKKEIPNTPCERSCHCSKHSSAKEEEVSSIDDNNQEDSITSHEETFFSTNSQFQNSEVSHLTNELDNSLKVNNDSSPPHDESPIVSSMEERFFVLLEKAESLFGKVS